MSETRIFNTGGVAALVGNAYGAAKDVGVYVTAKRSEGLLILKPRNVNGLPTSHRKLLPRVSPSTPHGLPSDKAS